MRWLVEVSSTDKADLQKYVVEAESWQRALQAARAQRGEEGPISGFSIELLDEGYRAVDPATKKRFVVKRAPDDMPVTPFAPKEGTSAKGTAPKSIAPPGSALSGSATKSIPPRPQASSPPAPPSSAAAPVSAAAPNSKDNKKKSKADRKSERLKSATAKADKKSKSGQKVAPATAATPSAPAVIPATAVTPVAPVVVAPVAAAPVVAAPVAAAPVAAAPVAAKPASIPPAPLLPVGAFIPGLPFAKLLSSREQNPTDASPLTYREYAFAVPQGTSEEVAVAVLRGQLKIVDAHLSAAKMGKLVNLAVFDVEFTGKPPGPPVATLAWKDWKGDPVIGYPRRGAAQVQVKPPGSSVVPPAKAAADAPPNSSLFPPPSVFPHRRPRPRSRRRRRANGRCRVPRARSPR